MQKSYQIRCPKCNNSSNFYRYGRDNLGFQKYQCRNCFHQFAPGRPAAVRAPKYPPCPMCGKASFLHHDYQHYSNFRCGDKKCYHSFFAMKPTAVAPASLTSLLGKTDFSRMRYPVHIIIAAIVMFFIGNNSFRQIALMMRILHNVSISHTTVSNWCTRFAPLFQNIALELIPSLDFSSDEWHADETVVKIQGRKHYIWFIVDSETRFVLGFHLSPYRSSPQAFSLLHQTLSLPGKPAAIVSDRYAAYKQPVKSLGLRHIRVQSFKDDIPNNLIEAFNKQFKSWYKTKQGFCSFDSANNLISMFVFFFNFVRPHSALSNLTPAQVAGLSLSPSQKRKYYLVA
jgi:putative transposase